MRMLQSFPSMHEPKKIYTIESAPKSGNGAPRLRFQVKLAAAKSAKQGPQAGGALISMIGQLFSAGGESGELLTNGLRYIQTRRQGLGSRAYRSRVQALVAEINQLTEEREQAISKQPLTEEQLKILAAESTVLHDVRELSLVEYGLYHSSAKSLSIVQNGILVGSIAKNLVGASGNLANIDSSLHGHPKLGAGASLLSATAGVVTVATPLVSRATANLADRIDRRIILRDLKGVATDSSERLIADRLRLSALASSSESAGASLTEGVLERDRLYQREQRLFVAEEESLARQRGQRRRQTFQNVCCQALVGGSRIAQGSLGMEGGWQYPSRSWMRNRFTAAGSTAYAAGTAVNIVETARARIASEIASRRLKQQHLLPTQVLSDRLNTLDEMESSLALLAAADRKTKQAATGTPH